MRKISNKSSVESIKSWDIQDRPREKLLEKGRQQLSNAELIALLIRAGSVNESAVGLSSKLLKSYNYDLSLLAKASAQDLCKIPGIGVAKAVAIIAALEIGRRRQDVKSSFSDPIKSSVDVYNHLYSSFVDLQHEEFWIVLLNRANKIMTKVRISIGGFSGTVADPKVIFKVALQHSASSIILIHNHPSGQLMPSHEDKKITRKLVDVGKNLELPILDHLIITDEGYYSFADNLEI